MKTQTRSGSIDERSVRKSAIAAAGLFRLRNGVHLQPGGTVLVRRGSGAVADAARWRRLPVPRLPAEDGGGGKQPSILIARRRHCEERKRRSNPALFRSSMDCFAEPVIGARFARPWLAMTIQVFRAAYT
jgi:hypothetical protein